MLQMKEMIPFQVARITELRNLIPKKHLGKKEGNFREPRSLKIAEEEKCGLCLSVAGLCGLKSEEIQIHLRPHQSPGLVSDWYL